MLNIGGVEIGAGAPVACIAEIGNAHNGDYNRAVRLLDAAKAAGASAAKLQCYSVDELTSLRGDGPAPAQWGEQGMSMRDLYSRAMTPREWFAPLYAHAAAIGLPIFSSVFGEESIDLLESIGNPCYKIAALDFASVALRKAVERTGKPVIQSCGLPQRPGLWSKELMLYAPPGYPQPASHLSNIASGYDGFSYHGTDSNIPVCAVLAGARVVEVHLHLAEEPSDLEANVSLTEGDFADMVEDIASAEAVLA